MATLSMKKCTIVGYGADKEKLIKTLHKSCIFEVVKSDELTGANFVEETKAKDDVNNNLAKLNFAFDFLKVQKRTGDRIVKDNSKKKNIKKGKTVAISYKPTKKKMLAPTVYINYNDFMAVVDRKDEIFGKIAELEAINLDLQEIKTSEIKIKNQIENLKVFENVDVKFSDVKDSENTVMLLGSIPREKVESLNNVLSDYETLSAEVVPSENKMQAVFVVMHKSIKDDAILRLSTECDFVRSSFNFDNTAKDEIAQLQNELVSNESKKVKLLDSSLAYLKYEDDFKLLYDYYYFESQKIDAKESMLNTNSSFVVEGWIPAENQQKFEEVLNNTSDYLFVEFRDPTENEVPPTLSKNNKLVAPFEAVTNMYSAPLPTEFDPNPLMAFFFFMFFGFMVSDAGYGIILTAVAMALYFITKPIGEKKKMILLIAFGGVSTIIWGAIFGGWFGGDFVPALVPALMPMKNPMAVLIVALGLGVIHILYGMAINGVQLIKQKKYIASIVEAWDWIVFYFGLFLFMGEKLLKLNNKAMSMAGIVMLGIGLATLLLLGGYNKKGVGRVFGGVTRLYDIVNFMSDVLSYSRLFGLGLATGIVGMVFNQIATVIAVDLLGGSIIGSIIGWIIASVVLVAGHTFNIGINTLGAYVHDCRLQYIEFYGKFYQGGGHLFKPLGSQIKYNNIKM